MDLDNTIISTINGKSIYKTRLEEFFEKEHIRDIIIRCIFGFLMGVSDGIPGYSGGTTLTLFGFYNKFMSHARMLIGFNKPRRAMRSLLWLIPFGIFWIIGALLFARFITWFSHFGFDEATDTFSNQPFNGQIILFVAFASISFFSLPIFFYFHKKILFIENKKEYWKPKNALLIVLFLLGFMIILGIGLFIHFKLTTTLGHHTYPGFLLIQGNVSRFPSSLYYKLVYVSFVSGFLLFIPGISSSLIMLLFNMYSYTYTIIHDHPLMNIVPLLITFGSVIIGLALNILLTSYLLKKYPRYFYNLAAGIISGAFITVLLSASSSLWKEIDNDQNIIFVTFIVLFIGLMNGYIFVNMFNKNKKKSMNFGNKFIF